ncbi:MAG: hypothetical protein AAF902_18255 [Chloroflexota bacterium]
MTVRINLEIGKKKVNAIAVDYPGWCRSGKSEEDAIENLLSYAPRYRAAVPSILLEDAERYTIAERLQGSASSDFGGPSIESESDTLSVDGSELDDLCVLLTDCWNAFDDAIALAQGKELRKGPRGGGRDLYKMIDHILEAEKAYLRRISFSFKVDKEEDRRAHLERMKNEAIVAFRTAVLELSKVSV